MTFAAALRSILRQDPDVILVGEIRDRETAEIAIQAAQTGHLVLSTLHTNDSIGAVTRLMKLGIDRELIASSLLLVIAQRLVRPVCGAGCGDGAPVSTWNDLPAQQGSGDCRCCAAVAPGVPQHRLSGSRRRLRDLPQYARGQAADRRRRRRGRAARVSCAARAAGTLMQVASDKIRSGRTTPEEVALAVKAEIPAQVPELRHRRRGAVPRLSACGTVPRRVCVRLQGAAAGGRGPLCGMREVVAGARPQWRRWPTGAVDLDRDESRRRAWLAARCSAPAYAGCAPLAGSRSVGGGARAGGSRSPRWACVASVDNELRVTVELSTRGLQRLRCPTRTRMGVAPTQRPPRPNSRRSPQRRTRRCAHF